MGKTWLWLLLISVHTQHQKECLCHSCDKTVRRNETVYGQWLVSGSQGHTEGPECGKRSATRPVQTIANKKTFAGPLYSLRRKKSAPKEPEESVLEAPRCNGDGLAWGRLPTTSTPSRGCLAPSSQVVTASRVLLRFLCITISLAVSSGAQQALEVSLTGRVVETGGSSSSRHSRERV